MIIRLLVLSFLALLTPHVAHAQPADLPTPAQLFEAAARSTGWPVMEEGGLMVEAHAHVTTDGREYDTVVRGRVSPEGLGDASFTMTAGSTVTYGESAGEIWFESEDGEHRTLAPAMAAFVRGHQFHRRAFYPDLELADIDPEVREESFAGERAFKVSGHTAAGSMLDYFYDRRSKRLLGFHLTVQEEDGPHEMDFTPSDWRTSAGQTLFWRMNINDRGKIYTYIYDRILMLP